MREDHKFTYKGLEIPFSVYGENGEYSATGNVRIKSERLTLKLYLDKSFVQSDPNLAKEKILAIKTTIDAHIQKK